LIALNGLKLLLFITSAKSAPLSSVAQLKPQLGSCVDSLSVSELSYIWEGMKSASKMLIFAVQDPKEIVDRFD
jgi:hypothetical protein